MGQKVNPIGFRLGYSKTWSSNWFAEASNYKKFLHEDFKIRQFLLKRLSSSHMSVIFIERSNKTCTVRISSSKPGLIIGKKGKDLEIIQSELKSIINHDIMISLVEHKQPNLDASIVCKAITQGIVERVHFKKVMKKSLSSVQRSGALGCKILISGRLGGTEIARSEKCSFGNVPLHTLRYDIDYNSSQAITTFGVIGVKVWINKGISNFVLERRDMKHEENVNKNVTT